jgi:hypothetical protein
VKARRDQRILILRLWQQIAGDLPAGELVEGHVAFIARITQSRYGQISRRSSR